MPSIKSTVQKSLVGGTVVERVNYSSSGKEKSLSIRVKGYLNRKFLEYHFEFIDSFVDLADSKNRIFIEVKPDYGHFASAQLLHAIAKEGIKDSKYLGVTDGKILKLYNPPPFDVILSFVKSFDPQLTYSSSASNKSDLNLKADQLLSSPEKVIKILLSEEPFTYLTKEDMKGIKDVLDKYRIKPDLLVNWLDGVGDKNSVRVNDDGWLINIERPDMFYNESEEEKEKSKSIDFRGVRKPKHIPIKPKDIDFFQSLRIKHEDLAEILHEVDRFLSRKKRRERGVFWTEGEIGDKVAPEILKITEPDFVIEPCVGGGSLIKEIAPAVSGVMNDISSNHIESCKKIFDGYDWKFTTLDVVANDTGSLIKEWDIQKGKIILLYTNPPFGTVATNRLVSKKSEMGDNVSRKQTITYPLVLEKYGKGDLFLPIVGRLIEICKVHKDAELAFFSPFGLFCGKKRYSKLFNAVMKDFVFLKGYMFAGHGFHDINKTKPISLSIWKYSPNVNTKHLDLKFEFVDKTGENKTLQFKKMSLLKDGWKYDRRDKDGITGELIVQHDESFDAPAPKVFHLNPKQGGSEVIPSNVIIPLNILEIPDELVYSLWSVSVGARTFSTSLSNPLYPMYMDNAYVQLPDFTKKETIEILAYAALEVILKNYAENKIGFIGSNKVFKFGNERLTKGVEHLFDICKSAPTYNGYTVEDAFKLIKNGKVDVTKLRKSLISEVSKRLDAIGYWDFIPIPKNECGELNRKTLTGD